MPREAEVSELGAIRARLRRFIHWLKYGRIEPGSREHAEIMRLEAERAERTRRILEERRGFGKY